MQKEEGSVHQNGHAGVGLEGLAMTALLVVMRKDLCVLLT